MVTSDPEFTEKSPIEIVLIINKNRGSNEQKTSILQESCLRSNLFHKVPRSFRKKNFTVALKK